MSLRQPCMGGCCWLGTVGYRNHGAGRGVAPKSSMLGKSQPGRCVQASVSPCERGVEWTLKEGFTGAKDVVSLHPLGRRTPRCLHPHPSLPPGSPAGDPGPTPDTVRVRGPASRHVSRAQQTSPHLGVGS